MLTHPACLRIQIHGIDLVARMKNLKSELGLRPIFHKTQNR